MGCEEGRGMNVVRMLLLLVIGFVSLCLGEEDDANWMKRQPGYISTQLHKAIGGSNLFLNYAVWESVAHFRAAFNHPDFKMALEQ